jgi:hypothetical protein
MPFSRSLKRGVSHALYHAVQADRQVRRGRSPWARRGLAVAFIAGSFLWFLPVLGIWMLPVGLALLSDDVGWMRRLRRRLHARLLAWSRDRRPRRRGRRVRRRLPAGRRETVN